MQMDHDHSVYGYCPCKDCYESYLRLRKLKMIYEQMTGLRYESPDISGLQLRK